MSIYRPKGRRIWLYDFQQQGRRFHGSTGQTARRKAEQVEDALKLKARLGQLHDTPDLTLDQAAGRWWSEHGQHLRTADRIEGELEDLLALVGRNVRLSEITTERVSRAIEKRRGIASARGGLIAPATVNRQVVANLRRILRRAALVWESPNLKAINWKQLTLKEPKPQARELTAAETNALIAALPAHWRDLAGLLIRYGLRLGEAFFPLSAVDVAAQRLVIRGRKAGDDHVIPLLPADAAMLAARLGRAKAAKLDTVWFRELKGGQLKPLAYWGAEAALKRAFVATGARAAKGAKPHDLRHTAATRILRASGNLKVAQRLLGHASIASTMRYAHAAESDVLAGLEAVADREETQARSSAG